MEINDTNYSFHLKMENTRKEFEWYTENSNSITIQAKAFFHLLTVIIEQNNLINGKLTMPYLVMSKLSTGGNFFRTISILKNDYGFINYELNETDITISLDEKVFNSNNESLEQTEINDYVIPENFVSNIKCNMMEVTDEHFEHL
jgi:hypothetical protein